MKEMTIMEIRDVQKSILDIVDNYCHAKGVRYFMTAGTLIGALRHKGFIPWDDDIDLVMLRDDYDRFLRGFNGYDENYKVISPELDINCVYAYAKVYDTKTIFVESENQPANERIGVNIDIFPLDNLSDTYEGALKVLRKEKPYVQIIELKNIVPEKEWPLIKKFTLFLLQKILSIFSYERCFKKIKIIASKYRGQDSSMVGNVVIKAKGEKEILEKEWFKDTIPLEFEGRNYDAPIGADLYMQRLFGNYMQLPPEDKRVSHHSYKAYYK